MIHSRRKVLRVSCWLFILSLLVSCSADSKNPLSDPDRAKPDGRLFGHWKAVSDKGTTHLFIGMPEPRPVRWPAAILLAHLVSVSPAHELSRTSLAFFVTIIGKHHYANVFDLASFEDPNKREWKKEGIDGFSIIKYRARTEKLRVWMMDQHAAAAAITEGKLKGEIKREKKGGNIQSVSSDGHERTVGRVPG